MASSFHTSAQGVAEDSSDGDSTRCLVEVLPHQVFRWGGGDRGDEEHAEEAGGEADHDGGEAEQQVGGDEFAVLQPAEDVHGEVGAETAQHAGEAAIHV